MHTKIVFIPEPFKKLVCPNPYSEEKAGRGGQNAGPADCHGGL